MSPIEIVEHEDAAALIARSHELISAGESADNNLVQLVSLLASNSPLLTPPFFFATIEERGTPIGFCVHAHPDGLVVSEVPQRCAAELAAAVLQSIPRPQRIVGPPSIAGELAALLANQCAISAANNQELRFQLSRQWQVFRLDDVPTPEGAIIDRLGVGGSLRTADSTDAVAVERMATEYAQQRESFLNVKEFVLGKFRSGELYVWDDEEPKAMVSVSGASEKSIRISSVFTPPRFRGNGYASAAVFCVANHLKKTGFEFVVLTADLDAPVVRMYERLDFYPIARRDSYTLECGAE